MYSRKFIGGPTSGFHIPLNPQKSSLLRGSCGSISLEFHDSFQRCSRWSSVGVHFLGARVGALMPAGPAVGFGVGALLPIWVLVVVVVPLVLCRHFPYLKTHCGLGHFHRLTIFLHMTGARTGTGTGTGIDAVIAGTGTGTGILREELMIVVPPLKEMTALPVVISIA